jgi:hypothetical protein
VRVIVADREMMVKTQETDDVAEDDAKEERREKRCGSRLLI